MGDCTRREFLKRLVAAGAGLAAGGVAPAIADVFSGADVDSDDQAGLLFSDGTRLFSPGAPLNLPSWRYGDDSAARDTVLMFRGNPARNFYGTGPLPVSPRLMWSFKTDSFESVLRGVPVIWSGTGWTGQPARLGRWIFFGSVDRHLYALNSETGRLGWRLRLGRMIKGSVCVYRNRIYVGCVDDRLRCIDAGSGLVLWSVDTGYDLDSSPCVCDRKLYVAGENGHVRCLDPIDGSEIFKTFIGGIGAGTPPGSNGSETSPAVFGGLVYSATYDGFLHCLRASDGKAVWKAATGDDTDASPVVAGDFVYVASEDLGSYVSCFDRLTGRLIWRFSGYRGGYWATPAVKDGRVYVGGGQGGGMFCLDARTGRRIWNCPIDSGIWSSPCVVSGRVVFGSHSGTLYILNAEDGRITWSHNLGGRILSTPCIVNGEIHVGTATGRVCCFGW